VQLKTTTKASKPCFKTY